MSVEEWNAVININLNSMFNVTRNVIENMRAKNLVELFVLVLLTGLRGKWDNQITQLQKLVS
jgi:acetoacetyl-CoA reductase